MKFSASESTGISMGMPPAWSTPFFTFSASTLKCRWQGLISDQVFRMAMTGLPAQSSGPRPSCRARDSLLHAVNVSILSVALGEHLGFGRKHLFELGFSALFHDIGKVLIPTTVINKQDWLNEEEWKTVSQHPDFGLLMLFNVEGFEEPPYRAMLATYEHHMKTDLTGYPRVIRRRRQGLFARIIALMESYDTAISHYNRRFDPLSPDVAIRQLMESETNAYDPVLVRAFVNLMGIFPVSTLVILDTGELGVVVAPIPNARAISRPMVRIVATPDGKRIGDGRIRDLTELGPDGTGHARSIARSTDPMRYGIDVSDYVA
jgi:HD-GYP domain-containing protein (c-di-GMP phosphodiesterase class II)